MRKLIAAAAARAGEGTARQEALPKSQLPSDFKETPSHNLLIKGADGQPLYQIAVIRHAPHLAYEKLDPPAEFPAGLTKVALAAAAFDAPEFVSGTVSVCVCAGG